MDDVMKKLAVFPKRKASPVKTVKLSSLMRAKP